MTASPHTDAGPDRGDRRGLRAQLLEGIPVTEHEIDADGIPTATLQGGEGPPIVLLHGPGESAVRWRWILPDLVRTHRVIAPDLPAHGASGTGVGTLDAGGVVEWLGDLLDRTCATPPVLVGHVLGGSIAARFAVNHGDRLDQLVLVDSLGLARFRPRLQFAVGLIRFVTRPTERSYTRFMNQCAYDLDTVRSRMGNDWDVFVAYNVELAAADNAKVAGRLMRRVGLPRIPDEDLDRISVPTSLIWGRHDRANRLRVAERVARRHGWPLHVIDNVADDPARDRPDAFLESVRTILLAT